MNRTDTSDSTLSFYREGGIYVHVPFCSSRCAYCGFFAGGERLADWPRFRKALIEELSFRLDELHYPVATLYFGGGTPSLMPAEEFAGLTDGIRHLVEETGGGFSPMEVTVEVNPESVSEEKAAAWAEAGVNRVSMGVQSMQDEELDTLGRRHRRGDVERAMAILRPRFHNLSLDIMYGIPGQTAASLDDTIGRLLAFRPTHLSCYELMYDAATLLTYRRDRGELKAMGEDRVVELYGLLGRRLADVGFRHYEVSNYSLSGFESRHNSLYWSGAPYLGLGPGASSYDGDRCRRVNPGKLRQYLDFYASETDSPRRILRESFIEAERLDDEALREEYILTRLRTAAGIDLDDYGERFGTTASRTLLARSASYLESGVIYRSGSRLALTPDGFLLLDRVILSLAL